MRSRASRVLLGLAGPERTPRRNMALAGLLALVAGTLNSVGFVAVGTYTSHMTGVTAGVADALVVGDAAFIGVSVGVVALSSFVLGAALCAWVFNWGRRRHSRTRYANVLLLEALLVLAFGLLAGRWRTDGEELAFVAVLCLTMGLQNALVTKISDAQIRTTHVTGMVTDIGIELGRLTFWERTAGLDPVRGDRRRLALLVLLVGLFFAGGVIGALAYLAIGFTALVPLAVLLLVAALPPFVLDDGQSPSPAGVSWSTIERE